MRKGVGVERPISKETAEEHHSSTPWEANSSKEDILLGDYHDEFKEDTQYNNNSLSDTPSTSKKRLNRWGDEIL